MSTLFPMSSPLAWAPDTPKQTRARLKAEIDRATIALQIVDRACSDQDNVSNLMSDAYAEYHGLSEGPTASRQLLEDERLDTDDAADLPTDDLKRMATSLTCPECGGGFDSITRSPLGCVCPLPAPRRDNIQEIAAQNEARRDGGWPARQPGDDAQAVTYGVIQCMANGRWIHLESHETPAEALAAACDKTNAAGETGLKTEVVTGTCTDIAAECARRNA